MAILDCQSSTGLNRMLPRLWQLGSWVGRPRAICHPLEWGQVRFEAALNAVDHPPALRHCESGTLTAANVRKSVGSIGGDVQDSDLGIAALVLAQSSVTKR